MARILVVGSSGGIGTALVQSFKARADEVTSLSRQQNGLDITDEENVQKHLATLSGTFDTVIVATGALSNDVSGPEKTLKSFQADAMAQQFAVNAIGPMLVLKHALRLLPRDKRAVFAALSARVGSIGDNALGGWYSYRASKAALNQYLRTASIELARTHKYSICLALHPGTVATKFTENYRNHQTVPPQTAADNLMRVIDNATQEDTGKFFDWAGKEITW